MRPSSPDQPILRAALVVCALSVLAATACKARQPRYRYQPDAQVHELYPSDSEELRAEVRVELDGWVPGPSEHGGRLLARLAVRNPGPHSIQMDTGTARAVPSGARALEVEETVTVQVPAGESRQLELVFFDPEDRPLPHRALEEVVVSWVLEIGGQRHPSEAVFRARPARRPPRAPLWHHHWYHPWYGHGPYGWYGWYGWRFCD